MNRDAFRAEALMRFEYDEVIRVLLEDALTFESATCELLSHIESGRLVLVRRLSTEAHETAISSIEFAQQAAAGTYRIYYERQEDGSFLERRKQLPPPRPFTEEELEWLL